MMRGVRSEGKGRSGAGRARACPAPRGVGVRRRGCGVCGPAFASDEGNELHAAERVALECVLRRPPEAQQRLGARLGADRNDQAAADGELVEQALGNFRPAGRDDDRVEGGVLFPAPRAVPLPHCHVRAAQ